MKDFSRASHAVGVWLLVCGGLAGCDSSGSSKVAADAAMMNPEGGMNEPPAKVKGRIFDADTGRGLPAAELKSGPSTSVKSDSQGNFELELSAGSAPLKASRPSYAPTSKEAPKQGGYLEVFLKDVDKSVEFNAEDGVTAKLESGAAVDLPPGAVRDAEGKSVKGKVTLEVTEVDGYKRMQASALPGEMKARNKDGDEGLAAISSAIEIRIRDEKGRDLTVGEKDKVTADLPVRADTAPERTVFSYDEKSGAWVEEGKAKRVVNEEGKAVYRAEVKHLSWWSSAAFVSDVTCIRTCVETSAGKPVPGAQIWVVGTSQPGVASLFAGNDGCAAGDVSAASQIVVVAQAEGSISEAKSLRTTSKLRRVKDGAAQCQDVGTFVLEPTEEATCAQGFAECASACTDPATDAAHCGGCDRACEGATQCLAGRCESAADADGSMSMPDSGTPDGAVVSNGGLVAWYRFEESTGAVADSSGNNLNGTASASGVTRGMAGKIGNGITFGGGEVVVPASPLLDFTTAGTIEFWINLSNLQPVGSMVSRGTGNNDDNVLVNTSCGNVQAIFSRVSLSGSTSTPSACNLLTGSTWQHVAIVNDGAVLLTYVNGVLKETGTGGFLGPIKNDLWIGKRENPVFPLSGALDELKWWNVARSIEEVCADAEGTWTGEACTLP